MEMACLWWGLSSRPSCQWHACGGVCLAGLSVICRRWHACGGVCLGGLAVICRRWHACGGVCPAGLAVICSRAQVQVKCLP